MSAAAEPTKAKKPWVSIRCECGETHGNYLGHYDRLRASCGRFFWVLQPNCDGPFQLFPWPGQNLSRAEMAEKFGEEAEA
jgi:hypothetical protein